MITGETLAVALRRTSKKPKAMVKVLDHGRPTTELPPDVALQLVTHGSHWFGFGTSHRISAIELRLPVPQPKPALWQECWRTVGASVLQPSIEWLNSRRVGYVEA